MNYGTWGGDIFIDAYQLCLKMDKGFPGCLPGNQVSGPHRP